MTPSELQLENDTLKQQLVVALDAIAARDSALARIYELLGASDESSAARKALAPEERHRYVALNLTRH